jgi:beta-lactamase class A
MFFSRFDPNQKKLIKFAVIFFLIGAVCGGLVWGWFGLQYSGFGRSYGLTEIRDRNGKYKFVRPLMAVDYPAELKNFFEFLPLQGQLKKLGDQVVADGTVKRISIYFRDLDDGRWTGVNENDKYAPASLFKVPVMIAYFKEAESDPTILKKELVYDASQFAKVEKNEGEDELVSGHGYTVEDLIRHMIIYSNNQAYALLLKNIDLHLLDEIFTDLGIEAPSSVQAAGQYGISAKNYSFFFRLLRNATFLNAEMSEKALEILSQTTFHDGLEAGVPKGIVVAHKFGIQNNNKDGVLTSVELHDCGIVYTPKNYFLCVMSEGQDFSQLQKVIRDVSALVYQEVK